MYICNMWKPSHRGGPSIEVKEKQREKKWKISERDKKWNEMKIKDLIVGEGKWEVPTKKERENESADECEKN